MVKAVLENKKCLKQEEIENVANPLKGMVAILVKFYFLIFIVYSALVICISNDHPNRRVIGKI